MSGGYFDYKQYELTMISDSIQQLIRTNYDGEYPRAYREETLDVFRKAVDTLLLANILVQRIDWLVSGDDGEETFHQRLKEDLAELGLEE